MKTRSKNPKNPLEKRKMDEEEDNDEAFLKSHCFKKVKGTSKLLQKPNLKKSPETINESPNEHKETNPQNPNTDEKGEFNDNASESSIYSEELIGILIQCNLNDENEKEMNLDKYEINEEIKEKTEIKFESVEIFTRICHN